MTKCNSTLASRVFSALGSDDVAITMFPGVKYVTIHSAEQRVGESGYPQAQDFAKENLLKVPTAAEATQVFERMATEN